jgi:hypothetical protein
MVLKEFRKRSNRVLSSGIIILRAERLIICPQKPAFNIQLKPATLPLEFLFSRFISVLAVALLEVI